MFETTGVLFRRPSPLVILMNGRKILSAESIFIAAKRLIKLFKRIQNKLQTYLGPGSSKTSKFSILKDGPSSLRQF